MADKELNFTIEGQQQQNWCWAANTVSVSRYYTPTSLHSQCELASVCHNRTFCCIHGNHRECDQPYYVNRSLQHTDNLRSADARPLHIEEIKSEIDSGRVICVRIGWRTVGGHAVMIHGYNDDDPTNVYLYVADPATGKTITRLNDFTANYANVGGYWTHSYLTQPPNGQMIEFAFVPRNLIESANKSLPGSIADWLKYPYLLIEGVESPGLTHEVFVIDFESLRDETVLKVERVGVRMVRKDVVSEETVILEYALENSELSLGTIINGGEYGRRYSNSLREAIKRYILAPKAYIISIVRQPELKVEAFWLYNPIGGDDGYKVITSSSRLSAEVFYTKSDFASILHEMAKEQLFKDSDGLSD